ncbi:hypothetical protein IC229_12010 [Spirosoma sp. BT702]|uniref:Uncharacterized protein n=1 Tax=Spirosoma profusum TaxID=2771354 RepID=A0A927ATX7_9BACT|nr:hypothetical protein [Spirosoma profusum]MBD2701367.1 hypothetical protein [Spirosoma profusum]
MNLPEDVCKCHKPPIYYGDYTSTFVGVDETNERFADVAIETCRHCGTAWITYQVESEAFERSGRWFRGILTAAKQEIRPEDVVTYLEQLDWYIYGGSYFGSSGTYDHGKVWVD